MDSRKLSYDDLSNLCAEAYQVVGTLASDCGRFDDPEVQHVLDNLDAATKPVSKKLPHKSLLPFPSRPNVDLTTEQREALQWLAGRIEAECEIHITGSLGSGLFEQRVNAGLTKARDTLNAMLK